MVYTDDLPQEIVRIDLSGNSRVAWRKVRDAARRVWDAILHTPVYQGRTLPEEAKDFARRAWEGTKGFADYHAARADKTRAEVDKIRLENERAKMLLRQNIIRCTGASGTSGTSEEIEAEILDVTQGRPIGVIIRVGRERKRFQFEDAPQDKINRKAE